VENEDQIDIYVEYTGTGLLALLKHEKGITDPKECYEAVRRKTSRRTGLSGCPLWISITRIA